MLTAYEKETIILFNEAEDLAEIYTHNKGWQKHLDGKLGLKPTATNSHGGKTYEIDKRRIKPPRAPRKLTTEAKTKLAKTLAKTRRSRPGNTVVLHDPETKGD